MNICALIPAKRWLVCLGVLIAVGIGGVIGLFAYLDWRAKQDWAEACGEAIGSTEVGGGRNWSPTNRRFRPAKTTRRTSPTRRVCCQKSLVQRMLASKAGCDGRRRSTGLGPGDAEDIAAALAANSTAFDIARLSACANGAIAMPVGSLLHQDFTGRFDAFTVTKRDPLSASRIVRGTGRCRRGPRSSASHTEHIAAASRMSDELHSIVAAGNSRVGGERRRTGFGAG